MARRQVAQIESAITDLDQTARALEHEIEIEHNRTGIRDPGHIAYSMYAKATIERRDNLKRTITELKGRLALFIHEGEDFCGDCGEKRPIHVANRLSDKLPRVSALRHSRHNRRYAASLRPVSGPPQNS
jgi:hypothetical protein